MYFLLIPETPLVSGRELYWLARVLEAQSQEFAAAWNLPPSSFDVAVPKSPLPDFCQPMVFVDDDSDPDALAVHYVDPLRLQPAARVYVPRASGFNSGPFSVTAAASHEALEALADPGCDQWRDHPNPAYSGVQIALEVGDPVQDEYSVPGQEGDWLVSNFVTPSYFDASLWDEVNRTAFLVSGGKFDRLGELTAPGGRLSGGYQILRRGDEIYTEAGETWAAKPGAKHPWARSVRRAKVPA